MTGARGDTRLEDIVTSAARRQSYLDRGLWDEDTLAHIVVERAKSEPDRVAIIDRQGARRITNAELVSNAASVAAFLGNCDVGPGAVVSVQLPNSYEFVAVALGVLIADAVLNPLLPNYRARELRHILAHAGSRVVVTPAVYRDHDYVAMISSLRERLPRLHTHIVADPTTRGRGTISLSDIMRLDATQGLNMIRNASAVSELIFTSGTEATPKGIMHTEQTANFSMRATWSALGMTRERDVVWMPSPLGHSTGLNYGARFALYFGVPLVLQDRWDPTAAARLIERERCTYTLAATTFLADLLQGGEGRQTDLSSMRFFGCGGAPVQPELVSAGAEIGVNVLRLYGSTEGLCISWNRPETSVQHRLDTDGLPLTDVEVEIRDEDGSPCEEGVAGEAFVRGPNTCVGYFHDDQRTAETFDSDGWVRSGDILRRDEAEYVTVVGRKKEIIIRGGMNVAPREIEDVIAQLDCVRDVAVVGVPDGRLGEIACAFVVLGEGAWLTLEQLSSHLERAGLARYKFPELLQVVPELPRTATGKVRKHELRSGAVHQPTEELRL